MVGKNDVPSTHPSLLARIRLEHAGPAWMEFVSLYGPVIYSFAKKHNLQETDAQDLCQEVFLTVMSQIKDFTYSPEKGRFRSWLYRVSISRIIDMARSRKNDPTLLSHISLMESPKGVSEWDELFQQSVLKSALEWVRAQCQEEHWEVFRMVWVEKKPAQEVAAARNLAIAQVYLIKSRLAARLEEEVHRLSEDIPPI